MLPIVTSLHSLQTSPSNYVFQCMSRALDAIVRAIKDFVKFLFGTHNTNYITLPIQYMTQPRAEPSQPNFLRYIRAEDFDAMYEPEPHSKPISLDPKPIQITQSEDPDPFNEGFPQEPLITSAPIPGLDHFEL